MKNIIYLLIISTVMLASCNHKEHEEHPTEVFEVTNPIKKDTLFYNEYVCQIRSYQRIELRALEKGYLQKILVDEGQRVKKGEMLFQIQPNVYKAEKDRAEAELEYSRIEYQNTQTLADSNIVSKNELALAKATLKKAEAELDLTKVHLSFTAIKAPFDGLIGRFEDVRAGSLLDEGELLTTLSNNDKMWVYFNVPEAQYLEYITTDEASRTNNVKLQLSNSLIYEENGVIETIESDFDNSTGNIAFRATFQNPKSILRHGQTGNILWPVDLKDKIIIPQKATFEILDKKYVFTVDKDGLVKAKEIQIEAELDHIYVVKSGLSTEDQILIEGLRKVQGGDNISYTVLEPEKALSELHLHAE
jgi:membrane fusion protein (multidrug efflux system)